MGLLDMAHKAIIIPMCKIRYDETFFNDIQIINCMERVLHEAIDKKLDVDFEFMEYAILQEKLFFYQNHYCSDCKNSDKNLQWHQDHKTEIAWVYNIEKCAYIFMCNNLER